MNLIRANQFPTTSSFSSIFDDFFNRSLSSFGHDGNFLSQPSVNIKETDTSFELELAAPGLNKSDFKVNIDNDQLTISAERKVENEVKEESYRRREFNYTKFTRSFNIPEIVEVDNIGANYKDGVLTLTLPKRAEAQKKAPKEIVIA